mgnify:CR=1 FL=1|tara:strand:+ start:223 stop:549 length:327 start_codon:yes stop_codon:yes gene_type:complete
MGEQYYCERCGEKELNEYCDVYIRPFDFYCSYNCLRNAVFEIMSDEFGSEIRKYYESQGIHNLYKYIQTIDIPIYSWSNKLKRYDCDNPKVFSGKLMEEQFKKLERGE